MKESCCAFGENNELAGIVTEAGGSATGRRVAIVLVNAGLVPKCGPFRLYADLARSLARQGFVTLRFDLGGIGDSRNDHGDLPLAARTKLEIGAALDYVLRRGDVDAVVLGGLCSGAEDAFRVAEHDERVKGVLMIDPFAYRTPGFYPRYFLHRAARRLRRALGLYTPNSRRTNASSGSTHAAPLVNYRYMNWAESKRILRVLLARGAHAHFVYTGGAYEVFNHERQLRAMFPWITEFDGLVTLDHLPELDHTQLLEAHRDRMIEAITERLLAAYGDGSTSSSRPVGLGASRGRADDPEERAPAIRAGCGP
jgi:dienelactone hydrolase